MNPASQSQVMDTFSEVGVGAWIALAWLAGPALLLTFAVGLTIGVLQAITQVQESSISFAPKFAALIVLFAVGGTAMFHGLTHYAAELYSSLPRLIARG